MTIPRSTRWWLAVVISAIFLATLTPAGGDAARLSIWCVACGERGIADFLLNIALFVPLGVVLWSAGVRARTALLIGCLLSTGIEVAQEWIPGRDTSLGDVIANTTGALAGYLVISASAALTRSRRGAVASVACALGAAAVMAMTGWLVAPGYTTSPYYGQWVADLDGGLEWYRGQVVTATLGGMPALSQPFADQPRAHALIRSGAPLEIVAIAGPPTQRIAPIFSIYDHAYQEILLIGPRGPDLVYRYRTRGAGWGFDHPYFTIRNAFAGVKPGDTLRLSTWKEGGHSCVSLNGQRTCGLGFTAGAGWSTLIYPSSFSAWLRALLGAVWVGLLFVPAGFAAPSWRGRAAAGVIALVGLTLVPPAVGLLATPPLEWAGAVVGFAMGVGARWLAETLVRSKTQGAST